MNGTVTRKALDLGAGLKKNKKRKKMKKLIYSLTLIWSWASFCAPGASLYYFCERGEAQRSGIVKIDEQSLKGLPSCMSFKKASTLCFRFERRDTINNLYLSLFKAKNLQNNSALNVIFLTNTPISEGAQISFSIKTQEDLTCTFTEVNWSEL